MKGYAQIYVNKKNEKKKKSNNNSPINKSKEYSGNSNSNCQTNKNLPSSKLTERNASIITFSDLKMMNSHEIDFKKQDKVENNVLPEENKEPKNTIKKVNLNNKKNYILELSQKRIKYKNNEKQPKDNEKSLNMINDNKKVNISNYKDNNNKFKNEEKVNMKEEEKIIKNKERNGILKNTNSKSKNNSKEKNNSKDKNDNIKKKNINIFNDSSNSSIIKTSEERNNYIIDINNLSDDSLISSSNKKSINRNNYKSNSKINDKNSKNKNDKNNLSVQNIKSVKIKKNIENSNYKSKSKNKAKEKKNSYQISKSNNISNISNNNNNICDFISNSNKISIESEGPNNIIVETKFNKNRNNNAIEDINLTKESKENILSKEEILYYTHIIFLNNSTYVKNQQKYMMSKNNFLNIIKSLNLISTQFILVEIDLIFDSISPKSSMIVYSQFNQILMKIIQKIYPEKYNISPKLTINYFLNKLINHFNLLFEYKIPKNYLYKYQYNSMIKLLQIYPNENQIYIINEIILTINEIYEKYFIYELNYNHEFLYKSGENLIQFCKDYEIVPQIINPTQAMTYYNLSIHIDQTYNFLINKMKKYNKIKNKGIIFTFFHFNLFLINLSLYYYTKLFGSKTWTYDENRENITNEGKLILFLEKLEHSKGMVNFISKLSTPRTKNMSLLPSKDTCYSLGIFDSIKKKINDSQFLDDVFYSEKQIKEQMIKENQRKKEIKEEIEREGESEGEEEEEEMKIENEKEKEKEKEMLLDY